MTIRTQASACDGLVFGRSLVIKSALILVLAAGLAPAPAAQKPLVELEQEFKQNAGEMAFNPCSRCG